MPKIKRGDIRANQAFLKKWDEYQLGWLNDENFNPKCPLLLPISVDIKGGIVERFRIKTNQVNTLMDKAKGLPKDVRVKRELFALKDICDHYEGGFPGDTSQSGTPPTPLDFIINCPVVFLFHLPRDNWTFTERLQFSVDNIPAKGQSKAFKVLGTFDNGHGLAVLNKNWIPKGEKTFRMKYNLHVTIAQTIDGKDMCTDIIIDPGTNNDQEDPL